MSYSSENIQSGIRPEPGEKLRVKGKRFMSTMEIPRETYMVAVVGSIALSSYLFVSGRRDWGIFVGLWAPTFLNLGLYNKLLRPGEPAPGSEEEVSRYPQV